LANGVELKAERRKPSDEKHCDIEGISSLTEVLAHFRLHEFNAIRSKGRGGPNARQWILQKIWLFSCLATHGH
jgi:hypothetical protein